MSELTKSRISYFLGFSSKLVRGHELIDLLLVALWAALAYGQYGTSWFLFGFALLMCGTRLQRAFFSSWVLVETSNQAQLIADALWYYWNKCDEAREHWDDLRKVADQIPARRGNED